MKIVLVRASWVARWLGHVRIQSDGCTAIQASSYEGPGKPSNRNGGAVHLDTAPTAPNSSLSPRGTSGGREREGGILAASKFTTRHQARTNGSSEAIFARSLNFHVPKVALARM